MSLRVRVLGTTELSRSSVAHPIGSERQRRLLAALAMRAPSIVSADTLVHCVWDGAPPANAVGALRTVVTRLRHTFDACEPGAGQRVVARPPGYALDLAPTAIDANEFADLVSLGRRCLAEAEVDAARDHLGAALGLWSGTAFSEFASEPWAQAESVRLERLWVVAREAEIEARLSAGLHAEVIGDIEILVADEPFADGPRALQMRALYTDGRQNEALAVFQAYRRRLIDEAGLEPGVELCRLEQRILENDPTLLPEPGRALRGYRLHERMARTDQGEVYRATQPGLERDVAVEVIDADIADDASFVRTFELRTQALARLGHAHVLPVYDCWREPGGAYLVSRLLVGGSLADRLVIDRLGTDGLRRVRDQVRSALDTAHQAGLVHGSVEAADVQLDEHDNAYLANFRLAANNVTVAGDDAAFDALFTGLLGAGQAGRTPGPSRVGNPYRGLAAFTEADVDVFFGRNRLVAETLEMLTSTKAAFVVGPSGSGKSSLVRAGVIPALAAEEVDGSSGWFTVTMTPGARPFEELEAAVLRVAVHPPSTLLDQLRDPAQPLGRTIQRILPDRDAEVVLVVDQFEELFTVAESDERDAFLRAVAAAVAQRDGVFRLVVTLRADYYDEPLDHPDIAGLCKRSTVAVDALSGDELRAAIVEPPRIVGVDVEPELVARLVADSSGHVGGLPLLQFTLLRLFENRTGDRLCLDDYLALGGLAGAIGARAEELYASLDGTDRAVCRRVFGRLVAVSGASADTRRRVRLSELRSVSADAARVDAVVGPFVDARLLATDRDTATREPTVEVAHEALFREWGRLRGWITDDRQTIASLRHLSTAAESWRTSGDDSELYRGVRLVAALDLVDEHAPRLTEIERDFVERSQAAAVADERRRQRQNHRLQGLLVAAGVLLVVAVVAGAVAVGQASRADERAADAEAAEAASDVERLIALASSDGAVSPEVALLLGLEAHRIDPSPETLTAIHWALTSDAAFQGTMSDERIGGDITILDDGRRIVTHTLAAIEVWDVATRTRETSWPFPGGDEVRNHTLLHSDATPTGDLLVGMTPSRTSVIEAASGRTLVEISHDGAVGVAIAPDGERVAIATDDGAVSVWDVTDPSAPSAPVAVWEGDDAAPSLRWHPESGLAMATTDDDVLFWDPTTDELRWPPIVGGGFEDDDQQAPALLFSGDGARLVVAGIRMPIGADSRAIFTSEVMVVSSTDGSELGPRSIVQIGDVRSSSWLDAAETTVALSGFPSSRISFLRLGSASDGAAEPVGDEGDEPLPSLQITNWEAAAVLPRLGLLVSEAGIGLDVHSLDRSNATVQRTVPPSDSGILSLHLGSSGGRLIANTFGGPQVTNLSDGVAWTPYRTSTGDDLIFAQTADGDRILAATATRGWVWLGWDGRTIAEQGPLDWSGGAVSRVWTAPYVDRFLLTLDGEDVLYALDDAGLREIRRLPPLDTPKTCCGDLSWSADGALLTRFDRLGGTEVYDTSTGERVPFDHPVEARMFGPAGTWFVVVDERGTIHVHDQGTGEEFGEPLVGQRGLMTEILSTRDGSRIAAVGADASVRIWDLETRTQIGRPIETTSPVASSLAADGRSFASYRVDESGEAFIEIWNLDTATWPDLACDLAGRNLTEAEWAEFGPRGVERRKTCPQFDL